jgi:molybdopterin converting factor small subunit
MTFLKKILAMLIVGMLVLTMATTAFATEQQTENTNIGRSIRFTQVQERIAARQAKIDQKKQELFDFKAAVRAKNALVKATDEENKALFEVIAALRKELAKIHADMKANDLTLDTSTLEQLANYRQQVKGIFEELKASKGSIQSIIVANKESQKSLDYEVLESTHASITEIQTWRNVQLNEINRILSEMLVLVR